MPQLRQPLTIVLGKTVRYVARLRGGGSALPGLFVEHVSPSFVPDTLKQLPRGIVVVSGTNGKTTTTKMVVALLESQGLKVFTNRTGSNFVRGIAAALLGEINLKGQLEADVAVLELDEAHAVKFVEVIKPRYSLILNVMRDQLDRFGEIDTTAKLLQKVAENTTEAVVLNREDSRVRAIQKHLPKTTSVHYFGLSKKLLSYFPNDDQLHSEQTTKSHSSHPNLKPASTASTSPLSKMSVSADVTLEDFNQNGKADFLIEGHSHKVPLKLRGIYNIYNSAAALTLVKTILPDAPVQSLLRALSSVTPAFGRGETLTVDGQPFELILVKNPAGFRLSLESFPPDSYATMIAINDNYADGRDMSWLWDVDFTSLKEKAVYTSGVRAYDMALRLQYDEVPIEHAETNLNHALADFIARHQQTPKRVYCTYTAMLALRKDLSKRNGVDVEKIS